jgi:general secretion pathway protein J
MMRRLACKRPLAGFTLLEMLVALAIFALLSVMSYSGLSSVMEQESVTRQEAERLGQLQKIYLLMQRDFEQTVPRAVRDEYGEELPPLAGAETVQLTRGGWNNPLGHPRSTLRRVGYAYSDEQLVRYAWTVLDRAQDSVPLQQALSDDITLMEVRYLDQNGEWKASWPDTTAAVTGTQPPAALPVAVEITLEHKHYGELIWLFRISA